MLWVDAQSSFVDLPSSHARVMPTPEHVGRGQRNWLCAWTRLFSISLIDYSAWKCAETIHVVCVDKRKKWGLIRNYF